LNPGGDAEERRKRRQNMNMNVNRKKIMNRLDFQKTMKMNGKKTRKIKVPDNVDNKMNMKKSIEANAKLNMKGT
jgi:hypothetical protein